MIIYKLISSVLLYLTFFNSCGEQWEFHTPHPYASVVTVGYDEGIVKCYMKK
jgi:hypothetical protein